MEKVIVGKEEQLLEFLLKKFSKLSRNSVKSLLTNKNVVVNGKIVTKHDFLLKENDVISFDGNKNKTNLKIIYEDDTFLVINKPNNLLTVATEKEKEKTAYVEVSKYVRQKNSKNKIFALHRLDKETSGVLVFCKNEKVKNDLQDKWNELVTKRGYVAVVEGIMKNKKGIIKSYLKEGKNKMVYSTNDKSGKLAITEYEVVRENQKYSLVNINLLTGRKNQIRVHFKDIGHHLVGDKKYGSISDPLKRMCLHATLIEFKYNGKEYSFYSNIPENFMSILK